MIGIRGLNTRAVVVSISDVSYFIFNYKNAEQ